MINWKVLTYKHARIARETAARINADHPNSAMVKEDRCYITLEYNAYCKQYVIENCRMTNVSHKGLQASKKHAGV